MKGIDIYLIDQILKDRYKPGSIILDAGGGGGRNLKWFLAGDFQVIVQDIDPEREHQVREKYPDAEFSWFTEDLAQLSLSERSVDHVICNAVLHFARDRQNFDNMFNQMVRVTKPGGSIFIRTCCIFGLEEFVEPLGNGRYLLPDQSERFLIDEELFTAITERSDLELLEVPKWTNVNHLRVMMTIVLQKR